MKLIKMLCVLLLLLIPASYAITASIGNAKMVLKPAVIEGKTTVIDKTIKVNNVNDVPVNITIEAQGDIVEITEIFDKSFILQPGESKNAMFRISLDYGGYYEGKLGVSFKPTEGGQGVGLSSTIIIIAQGPTNPNPDIEPVNFTGNVTNNGNNGNNSTNTTGGVTIGPGNNQNNNGNNPGTTPPKDTVTSPITKKIVPILVGFIIIMSIVAVGMAAYLLLVRGKR